MGTEGQVRSRPSQERSDERKPRGFLHRRLRVNWQAQRPAGKEMGQPRPGQAPSPSGQQVQLR